MKPARGANRRFLPTSPFNNMPAAPPVERFDVQDQVTHDSFGLGRVLEVEDDGRGFVPAPAAGTSGPFGYGLPGMRERAELLGGRLEVISYPGQGTLLRLLFPAVAPESDAP